MLGNLQRAGLEKRERREAGLYAHSRRFFLVGAA